MKIDRHTTLEQFAPFAALVSEADMERVRKGAVSDKFGDAGFYGMTIGDFTAVCAGDPRPLLQSGGRTVFDACRVEAFKAFVDEFAAMLRRLTPPKTPEAVKASAGTLQYEFTEGLYVFCRSYFGLPSFEAVDGLRVSEFVMAKKDDYNRQIVERNAIAAAKKGGKP